MKNILIVEDEPVELESLLQRWGYRSYVASSGPDAIKIVLDENPDLILMDTLLEGEMDGIDVAKIIKEKMDVPIIFLTACHDEKTTTKAKSVLPHNYISQPFEAQKLKYTLEMVLKKHEMEKKIKESEKHYKLLADNVTDVICVCDLKGITRYISPSCYSLVGYEAEEIIGKELCELAHMEDLDTLYKSISSLVQDPSVNGQAEFRLTRKDGSYIWVETTGKIILNEDTGKDEIITITRDISERKKLQHQIKKSLEEKELLVKETHHRVKNNLSIISSLLSLQSRYIKDGDTRRMFLESQNRIRAMALIHERLYQSTDLKSINFGGYLEILAPELLSNYNIDKSIKMEIEVIDVRIDVNTAIPLGIILNELVSNSIKHAFPPGRTGTIKISLEKLPNDLLILEISDNGIGLPEDLDMDSAESFGMNIVNTLVRQLDANLEMKTDKGTVFQIIFRSSFNSDFEGH
ncbi:MAG: histidine kinase dimerization/phosphoacceptor domain -containing protein [Methanobacteriaceae archaeon]|nr:histidine kinase dimerization/phosphoacceptor domain -containing protein [Methanobacteriaceae archaeon]